MNAGIADTKIAGIPAAPDPSHEVYRIGGTHLRTPPSPDGRPYKLLIGLPYGYQNQPRTRYPVLYLCDGNWDFLLLLGLYGPLLADAAIEEFIIVGLAYGSGYADAPGIRDRTIDLVPTALDTLASRPEATPCGRYLSYLTDTFAPFVEREYRVDPSRRVIAGGSIGGTFSLLALLRRPDFFTGAIALGPCLHLGNHAVQRCEEEYHGRHDTRHGWLRRSRRTWRARVFIAVGGADNPQVVKPARDFARRLRRRRYAGLEHRFWVADGETHATVKGEGFTRGLTYVFHPRAGRKEPGPDET